MLGVSHNPGNGSHIGVNPLHVVLSIFCRCLIGKQGLKKKKKDSNLLRQIPCGENEKWCDREDKPSCGVRHAWRQIWGGLDVHAGSKDEPRHSDGPLQLRQGRLRMAFHGCPLFSSKVLNDELLHMTGADMKHHRCVFLFISFSGLLFL